MGWGKASYSHYLIVSFRICGLVRSVLDCLSQGLDVRLVCGTLKASFPWKSCASGWGGVLNQLSCEVTSFKRKCVPAYVVRIMVFSQGCWDFPSVPFILFFFKQMHSSE